MVNVVMKMLMPVRFVQVLFTDNNLNVFNMSFLTHYTKKVFFIAILFFIGIVNANIFEGLRVCTVSSNSSENWGHCIPMSGGNYQCVYPATDGNPCNGDVVVR